jgi:hypothetical protein
MQPLMSENGERAVRVRLPFEDTEMQRLHEKVLQQGNPVAGRPTQARG